ncbi:MAG: gliding motility-associated C-terminal domain-containing protein [Flavobacteriales bacterium]|nr:gliding motility-associated C-terminal domain-containing protein [Flavobacteriales bacterium]
MVRSSPLAVFLFVATYAWGQNLVVNPSFEITSTNCAAFGGEGFFTDLTGSWDNASSNVLGDSCSSPDLFSSCNLIFGIPGPTHMPSSFLGFQYSRTGTRHAGIITHEILSQYREYIQGRTSSPLVAGQTYCVSMYVSRGDNVPFATNNIGVRFTNAPFFRDPCPGGNNSLIELPPQLNYACEAITDTSGWMRLQWDYVASGGESYFVIGNFFNNANTIIETVGGGFLNPFAYYYIDDVSIVASSCCYADLVGPTTYCVDDALVTLVATGGVGTICDGTVTGNWSGPGITDPSLGTFDPQVAGVGSHTITFTLACGFAATMQVTVGPCTTLVVCVDGTTGELTASNGVGPYTWQNQTTIQDCSACLFGCFLPPNCAVDVLSWTTFATGNTIPTPAGYPIQLIDGAGTILLITDPSLLPSCSPCPTITVGVTDQVNVLCFGGNTGAATVQASGGDGSYTYVWSPGSLNGSTQSTLLAGTYTVTATDGAGCTGTTAVIITGPTSPLQVQLVNVTGASCAGGNGTATVSISGGTGATAIVWSPVGGNGTTATGLDEGSYTVTVTDANDCSASLVIDVPSLEGPTIEGVVSTPSACVPATGTITITATGNGLEYSIDGIVFQASNLFNAVAGGTYTVVVRDTNGCTSTASVTVAVPASPVPVTTGPEVGCIGEEISLTTTVPFSSYDWSTGDNDAVTSVTQTGVVTVTVTDAQGCTGTSAPFAVSFEGPTAAFSTTPASPQLPGTTVDFFDASTSIGGPITSWSWDLGNGGNANTPDASWTYDEPGQYVVTLVVTTANGCTDSVTMTYVIRPADITIPNVITPNGDGMNDAFLIENIEFFQNELAIFDRWGIIVYEKKDYRNQWKGEEQPEGTYYYVLVLEDGREFTGHLTLLR